jgi:anti-sigma B factor antagonist
LGGRTGAAGLTLLLIISQRSIGDVTILDLSGRLVLFEGDALLRQTVDDLVRQGRVKLIVDLANVSYIDSAGIGMLIAKYLSVRRKAGDLKLLHLNTRGMLVMTITKLLTVFETFDSEEDALQSFASA